MFGSFDGFSHRRVSDFQVAASRTRDDIQRKSNGFVIYHNVVYYLDRKSYLGSNKLYGKQAQIIETPPNIRSNEEFPTLKRLFWNVYNATYVHEYIIVAYRYVCC